MAALVGGGDPKVREEVLGAQREVTELQSEAAKLRTENGSLLDRARVKDDRMAAAEAQLTDLTSDRDRLKAGLREKVRASLNTPPKRPRVPSPQCK